MEFRGSKPVVSGSKPLTGGEIPDEPAKSNKKIHLGPLNVGKNTNGSN